MNRRRLLRRPAALLLVGTFGLSGCALFGAPEGPQADAAYPIEVVEGPAIVDFHLRAASFYGRLAHRRFNVIATFRDEFLREFFRSDGAFSDYYADFARELDDAYFDRNRPGLLEVTEFSLHGPGEARVQIRIRGEDGRPLRPGAVTYRREDRWERVAGVWWIVPGKL